MKNHWKDKQKKGFLFWITGLSGSGKTSIAKKIKKEIEDHFGPTILISGDDVRNIFNLKGYSYKQRYETVMKYCKLSCFLTNQNIKTYITDISVALKLLTKPEAIIVVNANNNMINNITRCT